MQEIVIKKSIFKRWWFWLLAFVVFVLIVIPKSNDESLFEVLELSDSKNEYGNLFIVGKIKNNSGKKVNYLRIEINLYDKEGTQVGKTLDTVSNLEAGDVWSFKAIVIDDRKVSRYKIADITGF